MKIENREKTAQLWLFDILQRIQEHTIETWQLPNIHFWETGYLQIEEQNRTFIPHHIKYWLVMDSRLKQKMWNYKTVRTNLGYILHSTDLEKELNDLKGKATNVQRETTTAQNKWYYLKPKLRSFFTAKATVKR